MIALGKLQEQQLIQRWRILVEEVTGGSHSHLYRSKQRLWMHVKRTNTSKILNLSPDTDIHHIGLPLQHGVERYSYISQCPFNSKELKYLFLSTFVTILQNDPNLSAIPPQLIPQIFQTIFVATGCDYIAELVKPPS